MTKMQAGVSSEWRAGFGVSLLGVGGFEVDFLLLVQLYQHRSEPGVLETNRMTAPSRLDQQWVQ